MLLFCVKNIVQESYNFELARLKKKKKKKKKETKNILAVWQLSGVVLLQGFFAPLYMLLVKKTLENEWYIVIKAYKFTISKILRDFCIIIYRMSELSLHIESTDSKQSHRRRSRSGWSGFNRTTFLQETGGRYHNNNEHVRACACSSSMQC